MFANDGVNELYINEGGDAPFSAATAAIGVGTDSQVTNVVRSLDVTGDNLPDLVLGNVGADLWVANEGTATGFSSTSVEQLLGTDSDTTADIAVIDLDFNGLQDVLLAKPDGPCRWFANVGFGMGFPVGDPGQEFTGDCDHATRVVANAVLPGEVDIIAGSQSPVYYRILAPSGAEQATGFPVTDDLAPLRDVLFLPGSDARASLAVANFFASNAIYRPAAGGFDGTPGIGLFAPFGNRVVSAPIETGGVAVTTAALPLATMMPPNTDTDFRVSNNGIDFVPVVPGRVVTFHTSGDTLVWSATLSSLSAALSPSIQSVTVEINPSDVDADGVADTVDNCTLVDNSDQIDLDNDGYGNACDADLNNDGTVNAADLGILRAVFFSTLPTAADFNSDGVVNTEGLGIMRAGFFQPPGPSAVAPARPAGNLAVVPENTR